jgi:hypothetical protein
MSSITVIIVPQAMREAVATRAALMCMQFLADAAQL